MKYIYLILLLLIPCLSNAEDGYWICIGSFRDPDVAAQHRLEVAHEFPDELRVVEADTPLGRSFRVVVGPFETALRANDELEDVRRARPDAWVLITSTNDDEADTSYRADADGVDDSYRFSDADDGSEDWEYTRPVMQDSRTRREAVSSDTEISDVAPPGYNVHRLNPDAPRNDD